MDPTYSQQTAGGLFAAPTAARAREASVPGCGGLEASAAVDLVRAAGLRPAPASVNVASEHQHGRVVGQEPEPETVLARGAIVTLFIGAAALAHHEPVGGDDDGQSELAALAPGPAYVEDEPELARSEGLADVDDAPPAAEEADEQRVAEPAPQPQTRCGRVARPHLASAPVREPSIVELPRVDTAPKRVRRRRVLAVAALFAVVAWVAAVLLTSAAPSRAPAPDASKPATAAAAPAEEKRRGRPRRRPRPAREHVRRVRRVGVRRTRRTAPLRPRARRRRVAPRVRLAPAPPSSAPPTAAPAPVPPYYAPAPSQPAEFF